MKCRLPTRSSRSLCRSKRPRTRSGPSGYWTNVKIGSREGPLAGPLISHLAWGVPRCPSWLRELSEVCDEMCIQGEQASKGSQSRTFKNIQLLGLASQTTKVLSLRSRRDYPRFRRSSHSARDMMLSLSINGLTANHRKCLTG
jgi:hypothetical protein